MNVPDLLAELGDTPDQIAASLRERGITGCRGSACDCPLAVYLAAKGYPSVLVQAPLITWPEGAIWREIKVHSVTAFVNDFDFGRYPDLVRAA